MKILGKAQNKWGWVRIAGWVALAGVAVWTALSAALRGTGMLPWLAWSGYRAFSLLAGIEAAALPLLSIFVATWLEEHDSRAETEQSAHNEAERAAAARRREIIERFQAAVLAQMSAAVAVSEQVGLKLGEAARAAFLELDGPGKGDLLRLLFEKGLLSGASPLIALQGADLGGLILPKAQLGGASLAGADLSRARLDGAHLARCQLSGANLGKAHLRHASLKEAGLGGCNLSGARLENASLEGADLQGARLDGAFLINASLKNCLLSSPQSLEQAVLVETVFPDGQKVTNAKGKEYLKKKEMAYLIDRL
jgi:uncharacterized protein YjbI with pentapeptide repeats